MGEAPFRKSYQYMKLLILCKFNTASVNKKSLKLIPLQIIELMETRPMSLFTGAGLHTASVYSRHLWEVPPKCEKSPQAY